MSRAFQRFGKCHKTRQFCSLLTRPTIPCACHAKAHLNLQKWREHVVFCAFWLWNVLRATTACTFSTSQLPKVVGTWCVLYILTLKCASRHNDVHFFISAALASLLFDPPEPQIIGKTQCCATFLPFRAPASSFFWLFLFSDFFLSSTVLFSLTLPHLCFSSVHIVGSLTSKLPLIIQYYSHLRPQTYHRPDMNSSIPGLHCKGKWTRISKKLHQCVLIDQGATHHVAVLCVCSQSFHCLRWSMGWHRILLGDRALKGQKVNKSSWHGVLKIHNVCLLMPEIWRNTWFTSVQYSFVGRDIWPILGVCHESIGTLLSMMLSGAQIIDSANL